MVRRWHIWAVNTVGGVAVLGSYAWGVLTHPDPGALWGSIPDHIQGPYAACMPIAAAGYLVLLARTHRTPSLRMLAAMTLMLVASAAWMPLSFAALEDPALLPWVHVDLAITAAASVAMLVLSKGWWRIAAAAFCWQTVVLDYLIWPRFFP